MRVAASVAGAVLVALAMAGCQFVTPQQTARSYTPADGVNGQVGSVLIRNVFLVTPSGQDASLIGAMSNTSDTDQTVTLQYKTTSGLETDQVTVPADGLLSLRTNPDAQEATGVTTTATAVILNDVDATVGALFPIGFSVSGGQPVSLSVPVLNGTLDDYKTLFPTPGTSATVATPAGPTDSTAPSAGVTEHPAPYGSVTTAP